MELLKVCLRPWEESVFGWKECKSWTSQKALDFSQSDTRDLQLEEMRPHTPGGYDVHYDVLLLEVCAHTSLSPNPPALPFGTSSCAQEGAASVAPHVSWNSGHSPSALSELHTSLVELLKDAFLGEKALLPHALCCPVLSAAPCSLLFRPSSSRTHSL